jgi:FkbM family methyltransferase
MRRIRNALTFVAACSGIREGVAMAVWLTWFELRRRVRPSRDAVKTLKFRGLRLCLDWRSSEHVLLREILIRGEYWPEPGFRPSGGQSVVDVGANAGIYCVYAATQVGRQGRVIAIEPNPVVVGRLEKNVVTNAVDGICTVIPAAISNRSGVGSLIVGANSAISHLAGPGQSGVMVPVRTLDEVVDGFNLASIDLMKIDVEGAELAVLQGGANAVRRCRRIAIEVSEETADGVARELRQAGFSRIFQVDVGRGADGRLLFGERS